MFWWSSSNEAKEKTKAALKHSIFKPSLTILHAPQTKYTIRVYELVLF